MINELTYRQIQWKLIDSEENVDAPFIELNDKLEFTLDKKPFDVSSISGKITVTNENGDTVSLKQGLNIIKAKNDFKYMPSVFILGNFAYEIINGDICRLNLNKRKDNLACGNTLSDYGKIELTADVIVPFGA